MLREFFYFQRSDRRVLILLLLVLGVAAALFFTLGKQSMTPDATAADSILTPNNYNKGYTYYRHGYNTTPGAPRPVAYYANGRRIERFAFDPNTADSNQLLRLGLRPWQVRNIYKYRAKGGVYRRKEDFARLYGLDAKTYRELEPYIQISPDYQPASSIVNKARTTEDKDTLNQRPKKLAAGETVHLNTADTTLLQRVPGIGSYWARRIVAYRDIIGGFHSREQLKDLEGFPADALAFMQVDDAPLRKININTATLKQLQHHPYINFHRAKAIIDFRRLKGHIKSLDELKMSKDFTPDIIDRITPYIEY